ncbi:MAG TPA: LytTR family DNA-binding domain-containing protein, partial [Pseudoxanthomonas sp.]|nr:LytTR family DNA-binding domain-containing protein [Pseudoxanthomonas sp.]
MRILIVEDEPLVRQRLLRMCSEWAGTRARFDTAADLDSAEDRLTRSVYDGLLLDLNLVGEDGFELLRRAVAGRYHCVVVSAHRERALQAFEYGVLDFVPKPFSRERLGQALDRLLDAGRYRSGQARYLGIWRAQGTALVELADVLWIRADGDYSQLRMRDGRSELHEKSLAGFSSVLPPDFVRCHRSYLVNLRHVRSLHAASGSRYWLTL